MGTNFRSEREPGSLSRDALRSPVGGQGGTRGWGHPTSGGVGGPKARGTWGRVGWGEVRGTPGAQRVRGRL